MYFPLDEYHERWERVYASLAAEGLESAVVWSRSAGTHEKCADVFYLSNYYSNQSGHADDGAWIGVGYAAVVLHRGATPLLVADLPSFPPGGVATDAIFENGDPSTIAKLAAALRAIGIREGRVGAVGEHFFPARYLRLLAEELPGVEWVWVDDLVERVRCRKSPRELDCIREAGAIVSAAFDRQIEAALGGGTQAEIAAAGAAELIRRGGAIHMIPVASGVGVALAPFTNTPLTGYDARIVARPGDLVRTWIYGPVWQGYWLDPGRTVVVGGRPTPAQRRLIAAANDVVMRLVEAIRPGMPVSELARRGRELRAATGTVEDATSGTFPLLGHGNGLFWEPPTIWLDAVQCRGEQPFFEGQVLGIETFLSDPAVGSVGVEQNIIVGAARNEILTTTPLECW